jgi:hypothetical protein
MVDKKKIHELVGVFYRPTYKTFYVNSVDGESFIKPTGVFVSLGITTSMKVIEDIRNTIAENTDYCATIAEISSKKIGSQFINTITNIDSPQQYRLESFGENVLDEAAAKEELEGMMQLMNPQQDLSVLNEYAPKVSRLQDLINKLTDSNGWDSHAVQRIDESEGSYGVFHKLVNYRVEGNVEYRLGIYVREK